MIGTSRLTRHRYTFSSAALRVRIIFFFFFFQAEDGIRDTSVTGVQTCALPIYDRQRRTKNSKKQPADGHDLQRPDRKSTRLNSSHRCISYAVFCLKKKNKIEEREIMQVTDVHVPPQIHASTRSSQLKHCTQYTR